ncbi:tubulin binding cofactor A [Ophiobolus disseminans]|uniref:Tubulin-specific chaperone A n=1 Tax=Ophiobolus disseminans TaxID=1469910 RepID=A0A6A6ZBE0_9PLEO|nr:tubulin binding cofactor A [Ophiobolus disseminans]
MPPPSKVAVATGSVLRLVKDEASYHKEIVQQEQRIKKLDESEGDENKEYTLRQEKQALAETRKVLSSMQTKISAALEKLEEALEAHKEGGAEASAEDVTKANDAVVKGKEALRQAS